MPDASTDNFNNQFAGKVAAVTGGTSGSGEATARLIAQRGAAGVAVCGRNAARGQAVADSITEAGCPCIFVPVSLDSVEDCFNFIDKTEEKFGRLDALLNVAGTSIRGDLFNTTPEVWDEIMAVNVRAPFFLTQRAAEVMRRHKIAGAIANIGSIVAYGGPPFLAPYATSKGALATMTRNLANTLKHDRIRVNTLNIGWTNTPWEHVIQTQTHGRPENWLELASKEQPFGRLIEVDEVARALCFLVSDESGLMTGSVFEFDQTILCTADENPGM